MKKYMIAILMGITTIVSVSGQFGNQAYNDDRYYYDNDFDWHWDVRVKISNGIQRGLLTQNESKRLYGILEDVERKEYAYQADGLFSGWEQQEIWGDVVYLNQRLGVELSDYDRNFYGFDVYGYDRRGYNRWFYQGGYDFFRFDKRGFGNTRLGYIPRPNYNGWFRHNDNRIARNYCSDRRYYENRGSNRREYTRRGWDNNGNNENRFGKDLKTNYDFDRSGNNNHRNNAKDNNDNRRNDRIEMPRNWSNANNREFLNEKGRPERINPMNSNGLPQRNDESKGERIEELRDNSGSKFERTKPDNRSENGNRINRSNYSGTTPSGEKQGGSRGPR